ncbi:MAG TPA: UPF0158 family protein [Sedimentisphaerales bacterium]|nr:UPF0158 family protein [Sedimentisphaerales bacterium]
MANRIKLDDIIEGLEFQSDERHSFLDKRTGEVVSISDEEMQAAEDDDPIEDFPDWQHDLVRIAKEIVDETGDYIDLPTKFDIDEYSIMEKFCLSLNDSEMSDDLYSAIKGSGAFGRFKNAIHEYDIADDWYKYHNDALKEIAIEWCQEKGIEFDKQ